MSLPVPTKFCVDCVHYRHPTRGGYRVWPAGCLSPAVTLVSPITGEPIPEKPAHARTLGKCGLEGKHFEPKPAPWWRYWRVLR